MENEDTAKKKKNGEDIANKKKPEKVRKTVRDILCVTIPLPCGQTGIQSKGRDEEWWWDAIQSNIQPKKKGD